MLNLFKICAVIGCVVLSAPQSLLACEALACGPDFSVSSAEIRQEIDLLPAVTRGKLKADPAQLRYLVERVISRKRLAAEAHQYLDLDKDPNIIFRLKRVRDQELVDLLTEQHLKEVMAQLPDFEARAREIYMLNKDDKYQEIERRRLSQILVAKSYSDSERSCVSVAEQLLEKIQAGESFETLAKTYSDDRQSAKDGGRMLSSVLPGQLPAALDQAVFSLKKPGDISGAVETPLGCHIVRLDSIDITPKREFEDVCDMIIASLQRSYVEARMDEWLRKLVKEDPEVIINDEVIDKVVEDLARPSKSVVPGSAAY